MNRKGLDVYQGNKEVGPIIGKSNWLLSILRLLIIHEEREQHVTKYLEDKQLLHIKKRLAGICLIIALTELLCHLSPPGPYIII